MKHNQYIYIYILGMLQRFPHFFPSFVMQMTDKTSHMTCSQTWPVTTPPTENFLNIPRNNIFSFVGKYFLMR